MASWWRALFPETLFPRRLDAGAERRLRLAQARAEEALVEAHVRNALMFIDTLAEDMAFDRAIDTYVRSMAVPEPLASVVATRVLVELGEELVPRRAARPRAAARAEPTCDTAEFPAVVRPALRLEASGARPSEG